MMGRPPCCDKSNVKRGLWTSEEDAKILAYVAKHGIGNWTLVPQKAGLNRCGKSCRLRWTNYLRPDLKHNNFTPEEEQLIIDYHKAIGSRWSLIAQQLPGRTDNDVKNHWNTKLKKKLSKMGIDPVTHKPFSQIISDYEKININIPNPESEIDPFNIHPNNALAFPTKPSSVSTVTQPQNFHENITFGNIMSQENSNFQANFFPEFSSSASSSSSSCNISEFLLGDTVWEQKQEVVFENKETIFSEAATSSLCEKSFVESMLDRDSEMQMEFPEFFNEYFNY